MSLSTHELAPADGDGEPGVLTVTMDDGKANALSPAMFAELNAAFDSAENDDVGAVVLAGRPGRFSGGFDLSVLGGSQDEAMSMLRAGFELSHRMLSFPKPVVVACTGHALAMGSFLLLSADHRVGAAGDFTIRANEVAIGLPVPAPAVAIMRHRLSRPAFDRAAVLAATFTPDAATAAGWLDEVVAPDEVVPVATARAASFISALDASAHAITTQRVRTLVLDELRAAIDADFPAG